MKRNKGEGVDYYVDRFVEDLDTLDAIANLGKPLDRRRLERKDREKRLRATKAKNRKAGRRK